MTAILAGLASCTPESEMMPELLEMEITTPEINALQTEVNVTVRCDLQWTAEVAETSWGSIEILSQNKGKGGSFVVRITENRGETERYNTIILKAGKGELTKTFIQGGLAQFFNPRSLELTGTAKARVSFFSPSPWTASIAGKTDWLNLLTTSGQPGNSEIICSAKGLNVNTTSRKAKIRLTVGDITLDIPVSQGPDEHDPIMEISAQGFYGINGQDYLWGEGGWNQRANLLSPDGFGRHRLLNAETVSLLEIDGLRFSNEDGQQMDVRVNFRSGDSRRPVREYSVTQVGHDDKTYWFKASDETYFIIGK